MLLSVLLSYFLHSEASTHPDEIRNLPGVNFELNYKQYSGYLNASDGKFLHYWFVESQRSPSTDPVVLWMNGGPGCSSLDGLLNELGPLHVSSDGKSLYNNTYSWNRVANVIFLEAPAGVGFSYSENKNYSTDDDTVSNDNYVALQHFFEKFPQFKKNDFYITGESYSGIYVPTLSVKVLTGSAEINFKGFAIGNGYLDARSSANSVVFFWYYHGLIGPELWSRLIKDCCNGVESQATCNFNDSPSSQCKRTVGIAKLIVLTSGINTYNIYADCAHSKEKVSRYLVDRQNLIHYFPNSDEEIEMKNDLPCTDASDVRKYLNQPSVREALHIPSFVPDWDICNWGVYLRYKRIYHTMELHILQLIGTGKLRGLIYNGDVDMVCNFLGDEWFTNGLGLKVISKYKKWKFNNQTAGFVRHYQNLTFVTIKGSGHMVPQDKPGPAFEMISTFLSNGQLD